MTCRKTVSPRRTPHVLATNKPDCLWGPSNVTAYELAGSKGSNIHAIGCIGNMGLIHHEIRRGSFKKPELKEFIRQCLQNAQNLYESAVVMIMDNAPCHSTIEEVFLEADFVHHYLLRRYPYRPMLNPIELAGSDLKSGVRHIWLFRCHIL
ncbi:hypothetical protein CBL_01764 [Carabus blaptoides fortunei]